MIQNVTSNVQTFVMEGFSGIHGGIMRRRYTITRYNNLRTVWNDVTFVDSTGETLFWYVGAIYNFLGVNVTFGEALFLLFSLASGAQLQCFSPLPCDGDRSDGLSSELSRVPSRVPAPDGQFHDFGCPSKITHTGWFLCNVVD